MLKNWLIKHLFCTILPTEVITTKSEQVYIGKELITTQQLQSLNAEILFLQESHIWKILTETITKQSNERMFKNARTTDDLIFGKAMLYTIDTQEKILKTIKEYAQLF